MKRLYKARFVFILCLSSHLFWSCDPAVEKRISPLEQRIDELLAKMSIDEKIGQLNQRGTSSRENGISDKLKLKVIKGEVGSFLNVNNKEVILELQRMAVEESPNGIPLIFARDVIHGYKTIFPIPLGQSASWNLSLIEQGARISAIEASSEGVRWTFAPMIDIARDPRWGRIAESPGEDPYLTSAVGDAFIRGFQTESLSNPTALAACAKHFVGYGAGEGGRDYNTAMIHEQVLENVYFKPFRSAVDMGVATFMTSFNELNGVPASGNRYLFQEVLRDQWSFNGFVVSDWNSIQEMIPHGYSRDMKEAAYSAAKAGVDMEMTSAAYENNMKKLIEEGRLTMTQLDEKVRNILRIKLEMGLFESPYFESVDDVLYAPSHLEAAKEMAIQSMVLLKNEKVLPVSSGAETIAVVGPLANAPLEQLGTWIFDGEKERSVTPLNSLIETYGEDKVKYAPGLTHSRDKTTDGFSKALAASRQSDVIFFFAGEESILSGEAHSRANIDLPGAQEELIKELAQTGKPIVLIIMAGRPITIGNIMDQVDAILCAWHPGTMAGPAVADLLSGKVSPSGRLPISWPKSVGQIPVHYNHKNTGRPANDSTFVHQDDIPIAAWQSSLGNTSHYLDDGFEPLYPFGYGLTYSQFEYADLQLSGDLSSDDSLMITVKVKNLGSVTATEVVQLYVQDLFASITRPVKELKNFSRETLKPEESRLVRFVIRPSDLSFFNQNGVWVSESGEFKVWVGQNASEGLMGEFKLLDDKIY